ncbi:hypothetical protein FRZ61_31990 [Hypericibacter adhaerens]|uniref:Uncharacterized protein n=1 Tax=Hypericibacter adhaerens TaxID=2602016 RepID=A0A5J6N2U2_9PROT|nr:hypothetical protein FRZ61_31990 [Hypericibacter adhaerens]
MFGNGSEDAPRDPLDVAGLKVLSKHRGDDLVARIPAYGSRVFRAVEDRMRAKERGGDEPGHDMNYFVSI